MKRRTRRILFWLAVIIFAFAFWIASRYAQGYKWDFEQNRFVRTGAIAVTANTGAKLFVDDRLADDLSFLGNRGARDKLLPGPHAVRLERVGYSEWRKEAQVTEGRLTDFPNALLLSTDKEERVRYRNQAEEAFAAVASATTDRWELRGNELWRMNTASGSLVADGTLGFSESDDGSRVLWHTRNELWVLWVANTDYQPYRAEGERLMLSRWATPIQAAAWWPDREHAVVRLGEDDYRVVELDDRGGINIIRF